MSAAHSPPAVPPTSPSPHTAPTPPSPNEERLARLEALVREHERLGELEGKLRGGWWRQPGWIVALTGLVAAAIPATNSCQAYIAKSRDVELARVESDRQFELADRKAKADLALAQDAQKHEIRVKYLSQIKDPATDERVLRYLASASIEDWARAELKVVADSNAHLKKVADDALAEAESARKAAAAAMAAKRLALDEAKGAAAERDQIEKEYEAKVVAAEARAASARKALYDIPAAWSTKARESCAGGYRPLPNKKMAPENACEHDLTMDVVHQANLLGAGEGDKLYSWETEDGWCSCRTDFVKFVSGHTP